MSVMHALRSHHRGGPETLVFESAPRPEPATDEVLVAVKAAAITFAELEWDQTWTRDGQDRTPIIPSHEVSGIITRVGAGVSGQAEGDEVYGLVPFESNGAAAEFVVLPAANIASKPKSISFTVAAAVPLAGLTAWQALVEHADVQPGERVLVHGGAGGVGAFAVQLAAILGAEVTATCFGKDVEFVRSLGARSVVDVQSERFDEPTATYDVVIDTVGGSTLEQSFPVLRHGGRLIALQAPPPPELVARFDVTCIFFIVVANRDHLQALADLVDTGQLQVTLAQTFPLADGRKAFESGQSPTRAPGKTVLVIA
jgi:NADPH:quinone reductase-like Zn-dependent oxidoreductase